MADKNNKELNQDALEQVSGGDIIDDAKIGLLNLTNRIVVDHYNEKAKEDARANNTRALREAARENGITPPPPDYIYDYDGDPGYMM